MSDIAIKFENISKQYRLGEIGTGTLSHDLNRWWYKARGKEDPYLKIGSVNARNDKADSDYIWALKGINLEVKNGEVLGIIGKNGAGKSTLLKILSKVTRPTTGIIRTKGRIASLLEVGTGFHQEMTGRENIYLNGSIMGMTRQEIKNKFDEIVDFAGIERYIDTPVKRYSSGMIVRLGFSVAAHLEPEILVVDEVLAVGDSEFQKKAIGKIQNVSADKGRTILFVSHNMAAVKNLCSKCLVFKDGRIDFTGEVDLAIEHYMTKSIELGLSPIKLVSDIKRSGGLQNAIKKVWIENKNNQASNVFLMGERMNFCFEFDLNKSYNEIAFGFAVEDLFGNRIFTLNNIMIEGMTFSDIKSGVAIMYFPENILLPNKYSLTVTIYSGSVPLDILSNALEFFVESYDIYGTGKLPSNTQGIVSVKGEISVIKS
jgi:lipopolysaccharide transport system ATP-binding protein